MGQSQTGGMCCDAPTASQKIKTIHAAPCVARRQPSNLTDSMSLWGAEFGEQELLLPGPLLSDDMVEIAFRKKCSEASASEPASAHATLPTLLQATWRKASTVPDAKYDVKLLLSNSKAITPATLQASRHETQTKPGATVPIAKYDEDCFVGRSEVDLDFSDSRVHDAKHDEDYFLGKYEVDLDVDNIRVPDDKNDEDYFLGRYEGDLDFAKSRVPEDYFLGKYEVDLDVCNSRVTDASWPDEKSATSQLCTSHEDVPACERRATKSVTSLTQWYDDAFSNASTLETVSPESNSDKCSMFSSAAVDSQGSTGSSTEVFFLFDPSVEEDN